MTNRGVHEEAAGMGLDNAFFEINGIDPDAEYKATVDTELNTEHKDFI